MKVHGNGTIEQLEKDKPRSKCRKWRLWVTTDQGRKSRRITGTYSAAQSALKEFVIELSGIIPNEETFAAYADGWLTYRAKSGDFDANTLATDARHVRALKRSPAGARRMDSITPDLCRSDLMWVKEHPQRATENGTLSNTTMGKIYRIYRQILQQAVDDGSLASNPMSRVRDPKPDTAEREALPWPRLQELLDELDKMPLSSYVMLIYIIACLGLRRAEACAVMDADVDEWFLGVKYAVKEADGTIGEPKSDAGTRDLPLPPRLGRKIEEWRAAKANKGLADAPTLCCNVRGGTVRPQNLYRWWCEVREEIGFSGVGLHDLRHSNLSHVARHMSAYDLMRYAGWSSLEPTKIYVHDDMESVIRGVYAAWEPTDATPGKQLADAA